MLGAEGDLPEDRRPEVLWVAHTDKRRLELNFLPAATVAGLRDMGFGRIGDLMAQPRAPLTRRFGPELIRRIDQMFGDAPEPIDALRPEGLIEARRAFAEPIAAPETIARYIAKLVAALCDALEARGLGARRLDLICHRVDRELQTLRVGLAVPQRDPARLTRLLCDKIPSIAPGFGIEIMTLAATITEPLGARQISTLAPEAPDLSGLIDILANRVGFHAIYRIVPVERDVPERSTPIADWRCGSRGCPTPPRAAGPAPVRPEPQPSPAPRRGGRSVRNGCIRPSCSGQDRPRPWPDRKAPAAPPQGQGGSGSWKAPWKRGTRKGEGLDQRNQYSRPLLKTTEPDWTSAARATKPQAMAPNQTPVRPEITATAAKNATKRRVLPISSGPTTRPLASRPTPFCAWQPGQTRAIRFTGVPQWPQSIVRLWLSIPLAPQIHSMVHNMKFAS